jgi:predicted transcriptional regulator
MNDKTDLEHQLRKLIFNHITEYPGVSFSTLKKVYDLNDSTLRYHLKYLERADRIDPQLENGKLHFYPNNSSGLRSKPSKNNATPTKLTQHQEAIFNLINHYQGISQSELMKRTSYKRFILTYNISKLIDYGLIRKFNNDRHVCYETITSQQLNHEMLKVLAIKLLNNEIDEKTFFKYKKRLDK